MFHYEVLFLAKSELIRFVIDCLWEYVELLKSIEGEAFMDLNNPTHFRKQSVTNLISFTHLHSITTFIYIYKRYRRFHYQLSHN